MELLVLLLFGALGVLFLSNRELKRRLERLEERFEEAGWAGYEAAPESDRPAETPVEPEPEAVEAEPEAVEAEPVFHEEPAAEPPEEEGVAGLFERLVGGRLLVWIGGVALVVAGIFLIRHSIEIGLVTPELRMIGAAIFGLLLLGAGEYARSGRLFGGDPRFGQALVGAGIAILYAAAYGAYFLHGLLGPGAASATMVAVTAAALGLSLRHGAPTALMGLVGGFLTPALVGDPDAGAVPLLLYLALLNGAIFAIAWRRGWTWLAAAAVVLSFVWTAMLTVASPGDATAAGVFILILAVAASLLRPGGGSQLKWIQPAAIGIVQLAVLVGRVDIGVVAWALFGALAASSLALALVRPAFRLTAPLALGLAIALLAAKGAAGQDPFLPYAAAGTTLLFGGAGLLLAARRPSLLWTAMGATGFAGPATVLRAADPALLERPAWGLLFLLLAAGPALLVWLRRGNARAEEPADLGLLAAGAAAALLLGLAVWDLLPADLAAPGWAAVALAAALAGRRLDDLSLCVVAAGAATIAAVRSFWMVPELSAALISVLIGEPVLAPDLPGAAAALWALALPAALFLPLGRAFPARMRGARRAAPVTAAVFAAAALYVWFKQAWGLADEEDFVARGFAERTILTQILFAAGWLLASGRLRPGWTDGDLLRSVGIAFTAVAAARLIWLDMTVLNPAFVPQRVGGLPLFNLLLPAFLLSAFWLYAARRRADAATRSGFWLAAFLAASIVGTMLLVRQAFQGAILAGPDMPRAEFYSYSLAGLIVSAALLIAGMRIPDKALRLAGLALLTATIVKVFLIDASELEGLLRVLSFLGLGAFLIGIGRLYGPILRAGAAR